VLDRPRLVRALVDHADRPLGLVVADAGYGKSTLLAAAARALRRPLVWYSLHASDADPIVFCRHLLEAFRKDTPRFGKDLERTLEEIRPGPRAADVLAGVLSNALGALSGPPRTLVLDDFHEVESDKGVVAIVETLLRHPPPKLRLWIASRSTPPLSLDRLRARGELFELDSARLAFTRDELDALFRDVFRRPLDADDLPALDETTRGWPTAVHLVFESLAKHPGTTLKEALPALADSPLELHAYLSSEVYARLDVASRRVLERTAALSRFDAEVARAVSGEPNAGALLASLARRGLVRTFGPEPRPDYACHDLVRRFVRERLRAESGDEGWRALEAATARVLAERGETERALRHALDAGLVAEASAWIKELAPSLLRQGRAAALATYVADAPAHAIEADPALRLARADAAQALGRWNEAEEDYEALIEIARAAGDRETECRALTGVGKVWNLRGKYEQVLGAAERGLAVSKGLPVELRARLLQVKAAAHFYLGQFEAAVEILGQVRALLHDSPDPELMVATVHNLGIAHAARGHYREASREFREALAIVRGASSPRAPLYLSNLAMLLIDTGELTEARAAAEEGLAAAQRFGNRMHETMCQEALAEVLAHAGDQDGALAALKRAEEQNAELRIDFLTPDLLALRGRIFCARGQYRRAVEFMTKALEHQKVRADAPRLNAFRAMLAWCELRSGRPHAAREHLVAALSSVEAGENDDQRMRVRYGLAEAELALASGARGEASARALEACDANLEAALRLVRERGYEHFLRAQAREEPAPLVRALARGIEVDVAAGALVEAGPAVEEALWDALDGASADVGEAALSVLGEVGGAASRDRLAELAKARRGIAAAAKTALAHVEARIARSGVAAAGAAAAGARAERGAKRAAAAAAAVPNARLLLFGPPRLEIDGRPVPGSSWRTQRSFHILLYLAIHPRGANRDQLMDAFWPGRQAAIGRRNFHPTLSFLRGVLPRADVAALARDAETYRLDPAYPLSCDLWEFDAACDEARRAAANDKRAALERAAALAERPLLEGLYGNWADEAQGRVRTKVEATLLELGKLRAKAGEHDSALAAFRRAGELDEFRESTRVAIVECLVRLGNRAAAVVEYERLRETLKKELDVEPLPETEEAVGKLLGRRDGAPRDGAGARESAHVREGAREGSRNGAKSRPKAAAPEEDEDFAQAGLKTRPGDSSP
jgi:LuxR family maltose regulon positive regulatory protein